MSAQFRYYKKATFTILLLSLSLFIVACSTSTTYVPIQPAGNPASSSPLIPSPPKAPVNLTIKAESYNIVSLQWLDNSSDEDGFIIYRDDILIDKIGANASTYQDTNLEPNMTYKYTVKAYNQAGESGASMYTIKTPNPPILVRLDRIGVFDNREDWTRGEDGEVYLYVVVSDGRSTSQRLRFPQLEGEYYKLAKNETIYINAVLFSTNEVGSYLTFTVIGYEDDGGGIEPLVYQALGLALESQLPGSTGSVLEAFNLNLAGLVGQIFGQEDDWLGSFEQTWYSNNNWGVGDYTDITCTDERGVQCLRLWFTIVRQ
jgi:hypothetical protein